jgi:hypothetical protein
MPDHGINDFCIKRKEAPNGFRKKSKKHGCNFTKKKKRK